MLQFQLESPLKLNLFGFFRSPARGWKHLTRVLTDYELMLVTEGTLCIAGEEKEYRVHEGEYLILSPTRFEHGFAECRCAFYWMHFHCDAYPPTLLLPERGSFPRERTEAIWKAMAEADERDHLGLHPRYLASALLCLLAEENAAGGVRTKSTVAPLVKEYIEFHRFTKIYAGDIARALGYHEKYLSSLFKQSEGVSLKRYLNAEKCKEAKRLLSETDFPVAAIASDLGFSNPHNFSRFFKSETGLTPVEFRRNGG